MKDKKIMFLGGALILYYFMSKKATGPMCKTKLFLLEGQPICDIDLPSLGFILWSNSSNGKDGWYSIESFSNPFNIPQDQFIESFTKASAASQDPNGPMFAVGQNLLTQYLIQGEQPLATA